MRKNYTHTHTLTQRPHGGVRWSFNASSHSLWMRWRHALPNCIVVPSLRFARVAHFKSWERFNFSSFDGSVSQSNHMPVQALAYQTACLCVRGGRFMWLVVGRVSDKLIGKLQRMPPCGRCVRIQAFPLDYWQHSETKNNVYAVWKAYNKQIFVQKDNFKS